MSFDLYLLYRRYAKGGIFAGKFFCKIFKKLLQNPLTNSKKSCIIYTVVTDDRLNAWNTECSARENRRQYARVAELADAHV